MPITHIHTYLVHPAKGANASQPVGGSSLDLSGKMFDLMKGVYDRAASECDVAISFNRDASGAQVNACRDLVITYAGGPTLVRGRHIAERLAQNTDNRGRLGLLFLIAGKEGLEHKVIISRFPADSGILAEQSGGGLNVEFLERIFMKSARAYKAVLYRHTSLATGFWQGFAVDKQMNDSDANVSGYWINDFLNSDFLTTSAQGTKRLARACRDAARNTDDTSVKSEIAAAAILAKGQRGHRLSARDFVNRLGLSDAAKAAVLAEVKPTLVDEKFQFDADEFGKQVAYRSIELDNGGMLTAETNDFDNVFQTQVVDPAKKTVRYTTEGTVVREKLGKTLR